jgi:hypothetical protein
VIHVIAKSLHDWSSEIYRLHEGAEDFPLRLDRKAKRQPAARAGRRPPRP